jgi:hypothetical protein
MEILSLYLADHLAEEVLGRVLVFLSPGIDQIMFVV